MGAVIAILCVILGSILGGGFVIGRKLGRLEQSVKDISKQQNSTTDKQENFDGHISKVLSRLMRIEIKLGIDDGD